ncbi:MAG: apolipoprotein N-acyltransferase [Ignavibacterium sp.]|nr:MAG: apolipoprotein N-acyltransferase [Ignavibacterium sp.]
MLSKYRIPKTEGEKKKLNKERLLLILSGIIIGISFPPFPFPITLFLFVGFIPYLYVLENRKTFAEINRATYLMTFVLTVVTVYWVGSWQSEADPFLMMGGAALLFALPAVMLIPSTIYYLSTKVFKKKYCFWLFPLFWVTAEYLLTLTDLKFPWVVMGNGLVKFNTLIQAADIIGVFGLSLVVLYTNFFGYKAYVAYREGNSNYKKFAFVIALFFVVFLTYGIVKISTFKISERTVKVGIIQPDINPWKKWELGTVQDFIDNYTELSQTAIKQGAKIIIWPETALPVYVMSGKYDAELDSIYKFLEENNISLLTGMPHIKFYYDSTNIPDDAKFNKTSNYHYATYNSVLLLEPDSRDYQFYGKMQLVPLGEHVPFSNQFEFLANVFKWGVGLGGWNVGQDTTVFTTHINNSGTEEEVNIGGIVCYESIFPLYVTNFVDRGADFITVVTNDSWYGNSSGPYQHKEFAALRAIENRRTVVRCANGGVSCIINALGETITETEMFTRNVLVGDVPLQTECTFYTKNPAIITTVVSAMSLWIVGLNILLFIKLKLKTESDNKDG